MIARPFVEIASLGCVFGFVNEFGLRRSLVGRTARASSVRGIREIRNGHRSGGILVVFLAEFGRAVAAARRYEDLRHRSACCGSIAIADIARRIFEEFYSSEGPQRRSRSTRAKINHRHAERLFGLPPG
jgi:hypothetical protein